MTTPTFAQTLERLESSSLSGGDVRAVFDAILQGRWTPAQIAGFLIALRLRGETAEVVTAAASAMRAAMIPVRHDFPALLDTCGTGGDGTGSVNLSTGAAIIAASCGVRVAKHGNRAASSKCGSADVLEALGVATDLPADAAAPLLGSVNVAFMIAPTYHPAMRFAGPVRKELGVRTLFNSLGPLANPAGATHQLIGAYADNLRTIMAETLRLLGSQRAWIVRGQDGLDEISPYGPTNVTELSNGSLREFVVTPEDFGLSVSAAGAANGGDAATNAAILRTVLEDAPHPARDAFILNAAGALVVALGVAPKDATLRVKDALVTGAAMKTLTEWATLTQQLRG